VEAKDPFFQAGKLYVYKLECELMQYSSEQFNTGVDEIDEIATEKSTDVNEYNILLEDGSRILYEYFTESYMINVSYKINEIIPGVQNEDFTTEIDILDFSERNPFGEVL
jgi:hypothetical protein